jgi:hypothetical protein
MVVSNVKVDGYFDDLAGCRASRGTRQEVTEGADSVVVWRSRARTVGAPDPWVLGGCRSVNLDSGDSVLSAWRESPVTRTSISVRAPERRGFVVWMGAAFLIAFAFAAIVLAIFGAGDRGTELALRVTARWSFLLFWLAYCGGAIAWLCGPGLAGLARRGRELGLAFASAQLVLLLGWDTLYLSPRAVLLAAASRYTRASALEDISYDLARIHCPRLCRGFYSRPTSGRGARKISPDLSAVCTHACWRSGPARRCILGSKITTFSQNRRPSLGVRRTQSRRSSCGWGPQHR